MIRRESGFEFALEAFLKSQVSFLSLLFLEQFRYLGPRQLDHIGRISDRLQVLSLTIRVERASASLTHLLAVEYFLRQFGAILVIMLLHILALVAIHQAESNVLLVNAAVPLEALVREHADLLAEVIKSQILHLLLSHRIDLTAVMGPLDLRFDRLMLLFNLTRLLLLIYLYGFEVVGDTTELGLLLLMLNFTISSLVFLELLEGFLLITLTNKEGLPLLCLYVFLNSTQLGQFWYPTQLVAHSILNSLSLHFGKL